MTHSTSAKSDIQYLHSSEVEICSEVLDGSLAPLYCDPSCVAMTSLRILLAVEVVLSLSPKHTSRHSILDSAMPVAHGPDPSTGVH